MDQLQERIAVVDVLRAVALFGIMVAHAEFEFLAGPTPSETFGRVYAFDPTITRLVDILVNGKFFAIFSFLFGLSFAIQLGNAARKGAAFAGRFAWRLAVLFLIGLVHQAFFTGDILMIYAVVGMLLIPLRNVSNRVLLVIAAFLALNVPGLLLGTALLAAPAPEAAGAEAGRQFAEMAQRHFLIKRDGTLAQLVALNYLEMPALKLMFQIATGRLWMILGCFLLGMYAGRINLFRDSAESRARMRRLLVVGGAVALVTSAYLLVAGPTPIPPQNGLEVFGGFLASVQWIALAAFYIAAVALLFWRRPGAGFLPALAPVGRMGLTTYLMQTVFGLVVFYGIGLGLMGSLGSAVGVAVGSAFFICQIFMAHAWMKRFSMGPVEWLWRSLTYFEVKPLLRRSPA